MRTFLCLVVWGCMAVASVVGLARYVDGLDDQYASLNLACKWGQNHLPEVDQESPKFITQ